MATTQTIRYLHIQILVTATLLAGCSREQSPSSPVSRGKPSKMAYTYEMNAAERSRFLDGLNTLRPGEAYAAVLRVLGSPHHEGLIQAKGPNAPIRGVSITYYLRKLGSGVNDKYDHCICLNFDNDKRLISIDTNVAELTFGPLTGLNTGMAHMEDSGNKEER